MNLVNILAYNPQLFDGIMLPAALSQEDVVNEILQECATMEPLYGDPELFHQMIIHWFKTRNYTFQRLYDTMYLDYNPLENAYRTETRETGYSRDYSRNTSSDFSETEDTGNNGTSNQTRDFENNDDVVINRKTDGDDSTEITREIDTSDDTENTREDANEQKTNSQTNATSKDQVAPYNDSNFHDTTQTTGNNTATGTVNNSGNENFSETKTHTENETSTEDKNHSETENTTEKKSNNGSETNLETFDQKTNRKSTSKNSGNIDDAETGRTMDHFTLKGSIGLITPQQMIGQERDVVKFNLYEYIATEFSKRFMIQVY